MYLIYAIKYIQIKSAFLLDELLYINTSTWRSGTFYRYATPPPKNNDRFFSLGNEYLTFLIKLNNNNCYEYNL